ncbi:aspartate-alanine antiporter [Nonomuraea sp. WAC 01424]|uniref:aspartate-alanine antiporter-like transporter n=1 Tax=Nonomuraea sp. WAC 01424 TaxID=2203200 RepID=UPI000F7895FF|nr:aspartate-alanine antiporter [Nonomuraea sp. WAC 01424]
MIDPPAVPAWAWGDRMWPWESDVLRDAPEVALFLCLALGFALGRIRFRGVAVGGVAGTLAAALAVGLLAGGVTVHPQVRVIAFAVFAFTFGYTLGPAFFAAFAGPNLRYVWFTVIEVVRALAVAALVADVLGLDPATTAGLVAGAAAGPVALGTSADALQAAGIGSAQGALGPAYVLSYLFALVTIALLTSRAAPAVLRFDPAEAAAALWRRLDGEEETPPPAVLGRAHQVTTGEGRTVAQAEIAMGTRVSVERLRRNGRPIAFGPDTLLERDDEAVVVGVRQDVVNACAVIGPEVPGGRELDLDLEVADVMLAGRPPATVRALRAGLSGQGVQDLHVCEVTRVGCRLPVRPGTPLHAGDVVRVTGIKRDVDRAAAWLGARADAGRRADVVYLSAGLVAGLVAGLAGGLTVSVGCLLAGLVFGRVRAGRARFGQYDAGAARVVGELALGVFVAALGLSAGPAAVELVGRHGWQVALGAVAAAAMPVVISLAMAAKLMMLPPPLVLGAVTGQHGLTAILGAVRRMSGNGTPLLAYTVVHALSGAVLALLGPAAVALARWVG